jgi:hypothetical protein
MRGVENVAWSVARGRIVTSSQDLNLHVQADVTAQGQSVRVRVMLRGSTHVEPLASGTPAAPQVSPDLLASWDISILRIARRSPV